MDCSLRCSSVHGIFQARVLEWGAIAFSKHAMCYRKSAHITEYDFLMKDLVTTYIWFFIFLFFSYGFLNFLCTKWSFVLNASMHLFKIYYEKRKYSSWSELWSLFLSINLTFETVVKSLHLVLEAHACNFASVAAMLAFFYSDPYACKWKSLSHVQHFVTPWAIQFMEFSRPEYWNG